MENPLTPNLDDIIRQVKLLHTKHAFSSVEEEDKSERPTILTVARNFEDARFAGYKILRNKNGVSMVLVYSDSEGKRYIAQVPLDSEGRRSISGLFDWFYQEKISLQSLPSVIDEPDILRIIT